MIYVQYTKSHFNQLIMLSLYYDSYQYILRKLKRRHSGFYFQNSSYKYNVHYFLSYTANKLETILDNSNQKT